MLVILTIPSRFCLLRLRLALWLALPLPIQAGIRIRLFNDSQYRFLGCKLALKPGACFRLTSLPWPPASGTCSSLPASGAPNAFISHALSSWTRCATVLQGGSCGGPVWGCGSLLTRFPSSGPGCCEVPCGRPTRGGQRGLRGLLPERPRPAHGRTDCLEIQAVPPGISRSSLCPEFCWALAALLDELDLSLPLEKLRPSGNP